MATSLPRHPRRRALGALVSLVLAALFVGGTAGAANAADGYRYWNYFHVKNGSFAFATTGPSGFVPKDGGTEAYRYGTSTAKQGLTPRADLDKLGFGTVCADTKAQSGKKRVAVLIDYGTKADSAGAKVPAPRAACASVPANANGQQVLAAVAEVRSSKGMDCALDGYPASGCGDPVKDATVPATEQPVAFQLPASAGASAGDAADTKPAASQDSGNNTPLLVGGAVVLVLLAGGAFALSRRTKRA